MKSITVAIALQGALAACTVEVATPPGDTLVVDRIDDSTLIARLEGAGVGVVATESSVALVDADGVIVAELEIDPELGRSSGSFGGRPFGDDDSGWRDTAVWAPLLDAPIGRAVSAASAAAETLLDDGAEVGRVPLQLVAALEGQLSQLAGELPMNAPQDSCTDYWGCYGPCIGYYYDWYWESHDDDWACSWYPFWDCSSC